MPSGAGLHTSAVPKLTQLVSRTASVICLSARPFVPSGGSSAPKPVATAVYGKEAGVGVAVSLDNIVFAGTGLPRAKCEELDAHDPLADCFLLDSPGLWWAHSLVRAYMACYRR